MLFQSRVMYRPPAVKKRQASGSRLITDSQHELDYVGIGAPGSDAGFVPVVVESRVF